MKALVVKHPVVAYFVLTFAVSWGGVLLVSGGAVGVPGVNAQDSPLFPLVFLAMLAGPAATGLALTYVIGGRSGLLELRSRLLKWRVDARWYAVALLAAPLVATGARWMTSFVSQDSAPVSTAMDDRLGLLVFGLIVGLTAGFCEELGWTGFAIPRLARRYGVLATGLIMGVLWSAWHVIVVAWGIGDRAGRIPVALFVIVDGLAGLPAFRVLMVWVYSRTGSLLVTMLMHVSLTACTLILTPRATGVSLLAYNLTFAAGTWAVLALAMAFGTKWRSVRATLSERNCQLAGDEFISEPIAMLTHAVTIGRAPQAIWPWLIQMGAGRRAGWYSYDSLDNGRRPSASRVVPELQHVRIGTLFPALPGATDGFTVLGFVPARSLTLGWPGPDGTPLVTWAFVLEDRPGKTTRLIARARGGRGYRFRRLPSWLSIPVVRLVHFVMQRKQLLTIARRVERPSTKGDGSQSAAAPQP